MRQRKLRARAWRRMSRPGLGVALVLAFASTAAAQNYLIDEIIRKADRAEREGGFCARTNWQMELSGRDVGAFYHNAEVGTSKVFQDTFSGQNTYCAYLRVDDIFFEQNRRCLRVQMWWCETNLQCGRKSYKGCWPGRTTGGTLTWY